MPTSKTVADFEAALVQSGTSYISDVLFGMKKPGADRAILVVKLGSGAIEVWDVG